MMVFFRRAEDVDNEISELSSGMAADAGPCAGVSHILAAEVIS
jgi:hypothetical protein